MSTRLRLRLPNSETREMAEAAIAASRRAEVDSWPMNNTAFFTVFVLVAAALAIAALVLR